MAKILLFVFDEYLRVVPSSHLFGVNLAFLSDPTESIKRTQMTLSKDASSFKNVICHRNVQILSLAEICILNCSKSV